jgi:hypothetical protein
MNVASLRPPHELRGRRFDLVDDFDGKGQRFGMGFRKRRKPVADALGVQEVRRFEQPVAAALHSLEGEAGDFSVLQDLRDAGAREPYLVGKVFARMELPIGELAQQRESQRSKHLAT